MDFAPCRKFRNLRQGYPVWKESYKMSRCQHLISGIIIWLFRHNIDIHHFYKKSLATIVFKLNGLRKHIKRLKTAIIDLKYNFLVKVYRNFISNHTCILQTLPFDTLVQSVFPFSKILYSPLDMPEHNKFTFTYVHTYVPHTYVHINEKLV